MEARQTYSNCKLRRSPIRARKQGKSPIPTQDANTADLLESGGTAAQRLKDAASLCGLRAPVIERIVEARNGSGRYRSIKQGGCSMDIRKRSVQSVRHKYWIRGRHENTHGRRVLGHAHLSCFRCANVAFAQTTPASAIRDCDGSHFGRWRHTPARAGYCVSPGGPSAVGFWNSERVGKQAFLSPTGRPAAIREYKLIFVVHNNEHLLRAVLVFGGQSRPYF